MAQFAVSPRIRALTTTNPRETSFMRYFDAKGNGPRARSEVKEWAPLAAIAPLLQAAAVKGEDTRFFEHRGVDWRATAAMTVLALRGRPAGGASTITQQLARNLYLTPTRAVTRKLREIWLALRIERAVAKARILELYLNVIEFGPAVWGCAAASRYYFGKRPSELDLFESTYLIVILPSPKTGPCGVQASRCMRRQCLLACQLFIAGLASAEACAICCDRARRLHELLAEGAELRAALSSSRIDGSADVGFLRSLAARLGIVPIPAPDVLTSRFGSRQEHAVRVRLVAQFGRHAARRVLAEGRLTALNGRAGSSTIGERPGVTRSGPHLDPRSTMAR